MEKISDSPDKTKSIGFHFSNQLVIGNIIAINGELGAGKTTFIKGILEGLGYKKNVSSPTYTLINEFILIGLQLRAKSYILVKYI